MRKLLGVLLGLAALVVGFFFTWVIVLTLLAFVMLLMILMLSRRLWFRLTGRQPAPFFVFRHTRQPPFHAQHTRQDDSPAGRTIDVEVEKVDPPSIDRS